MDDELVWTADIDSDSGVASDCARAEQNPAAYRGGEFVYGGEGWGAYTVDRVDASEWVVVTDSGTMKDFLDEEDARGLMWIHIRRFRSPEDRATWLAAERRRREDERRGLFS